MKTKHKKQASAHVLKKLMRFAKPYLPLMLLAFVFGAVSVTATLLATVFVGEAVDCIARIGGVDWEGVFSALIKLGAAALAASLFNYLMNVASTYVSHNTARRLREAALYKIVYSPLKIIDNLSPGDVIARIGVDTDVISDGLIQGFTQLFSGVATIVGTIIFMLTINLPTTLVVVVITPLSLIVSWFIARTIHKYFLQQSALRGQISGITAECVQNQKLIKAFGYEDECIERFDEVNDKLDVVGVKAGFMSSMSNPATRFVNGIVYAAVAVFGAMYVVKGGANGMTIGDLSCFLAYANQYTKPFNEISSVIAELQSAVASASRVFALTDQPVESNDGVIDLTSRQVNGNIDMTGVKFGYTEEKTLITDLNLHVTQGRRVAIVGPTGCGKSTLINLLMRFYDTNEGSICVDGTDITDVTRNSLRRSYGMVLQETFLINATIADNIAYGKPDSTREEIEAAAKAAHCHNFITLLPSGYDTVLTDEGDSLSIGQKQLLCIARVMLTRPPMLILDEATSNIDTRTEQTIQRAFAKLTRDKTSFVVAHRFATIIDADLILVMRDGDIVEQGKHEDLMKKKGFYYTLFRSQF